MATNNITATTNSNKHTALGAGVALGARGIKTPTATQAEHFGIDVPIGTNYRRPRKSVANIDRTASNPSGYTKAGVTSFGDGRISRSKTWQNDDGFYEQTIVFYTGAKPERVRSNGYLNAGSGTFTTVGKYTTGTWTFTVPKSCTSLVFEIIGAGGDGYSGTGSNDAGGGGGGGGYVRSNNLTTTLNGVDLTLTISDIVTKVYNGSTRIVEADAGGNSTGADGGIAGTTSVTNAAVRYNGGVGGTGDSLGETTGGGGGGGCGGPTSAGSVGADGTAAPVAGGAGGGNANSTLFGGNGGTNAIEAEVGDYGCGGGGAYSGAGGYGGPGLIVVRMTCLT